MEVQKWKVKAPNNGKCNKISLLHCFLQPIGHMWLRLHFCKTWNTLFWVHFTALFRWHAHNKRYKWYPLQMRLYWTAQCYLQHDIELPVACFTAVSKLNLRWLPLNSMFNFLQKLKVTAKSWLCWLMHMSWQSGNELCLINGDKMYSYSVNNYTNPYPKPNR